MGSSHFWASKQDPGLRNLVPIAIVDKIISKIASGQDFCCYAIIPLFPEVSYCFFTCFNFIAQSNPNIQKKIKQTKGRSREYERQSFTSLAI